MNTPVARERMTRLTTMPRPVRRMRQADRDGRGCPSLFRGPSTKDAIPNNERGLILPRIPAAHFGQELTQKRVFRPNRLATSVTSEKKRGIFGPDRSRAARPIVRWLPRTAHTEPTGRSAHRRHAQH